MKYFASYSKVDNKGDLKISANATGANALYTPISPDSVNEAFYFRVCGKK